MGTYRFLIVIALGASVAASAAHPSYDSSPSLLNADQSKVLSMARALLTDNFNAGGIYPQVWIRDSATFIDVACDVNDQAVIAEILETFLGYQKSTGEVPDGYIPGASFLADDATPFLVCDGSGQIACKNTCASDQETSLVQAVRTYVDYFGDWSFLMDKVTAQSTGVSMTVVDRLDAALEWIRRENTDEVTGLLWGTTTMDWGDCQPDDFFPGHHDFDCRMRNASFSHLAIDAYDNAMFVRAARDLEYLYAGVGLAKSASRWGERADAISAQVNALMWDEATSHYIPHLYLDGSPFPPEFDEDSLFAMGGTACAALAGMLSPEQVLASYNFMKSNVAGAAADGGDMTIGITIYPPYPKFWQLPHIMDEFTYQNGGDWTWYGGRMVNALIDYGFVDEAQEALAPMVARVLAKNERGEATGFHEWWDFDGAPQGANEFRGSAGVLGEAIKKLDRKMKQLRRNREGRD